MTASSHAAGQSVLDIASVKQRYPEHFSLPAPQKMRRAAMLGLFVGALLLAVVRLDFSIWGVFDGLKALAGFVVLMFPPSYGIPDKLASYMHALGETVAIALLGTILAATIALPFAFLASRNVMPLSLLRIATRRSSDVIRGIDQLIWALIWVGVVGLGPMAGVLAVATSDIGTFIKICSEAIETADRKPAEGIASVGGGPLTTIRYAIVPQVLPVIAGQILYLFESNTRSSTIIGIVGAGGIGLHLSEQIRTLEWQHVSFLVGIVLVTVALIDFVSTRLRAAIIGAAKAPGELH